MTREVSFPFELFPPADVGRGIRLAAEGRLSINRKDYGVVYSNSLEDAAIRDGVVIDLAIDVDRK